MRALKEAPAVAEKLESGALTLTTVARARKFLRVEAEQRKAVGAPALDGAAKREVFEALSGKSVREAEMILNARALAPVVTKTVKIELSVEDYEKLLTLQSLFSHRKDGATPSGVVSLLLEEGLERHDPARRFARAEKRRAAAGETSLWAPKVKATQCSETLTRAPSARPIYGGPAGGRDLGSLLRAFKEKGSVPSRYVPAEVKRAVWVRDGGACSVAGCGSSKWLEIDHITPFSHGGGNTAENLRLLCSDHHRIVTEEVFGP
jgi:hypothetical protein